MNKTKGGVKTPIKTNIMERLNKAKKLHKRHSRIFFKEISEDEKTLVVRVEQKRNHNGNYFDVKRLIEIVKETYDHILNGRELIVHPITFQSSPPDIVTGEWIKERMNKYKVGNKKIVIDTGIPKSDVSAMINGHKDMGIRTKSMFFYLFKFYESKTVATTT